CPRRCMGGCGPPPGHPTPDPTTTRRNATVAAPPGHPTPDPTTAKRNAQGAPRLRPLQRPDVRCALTQTGSPRGTGPPTALGSGRSRRSDPGRVAPRPPPAPTPPPPAAPRP